VASPLSPAPAALTQAAAAPDTHCPFARKAVRFYRGRYLTHRAKMGAGRPQSHQAQASCSLSRWLVEVWRDRAYIARRTLEIKAELRRQLLSNPTEAILHVFGPYGDEALRVASCESGRGVSAQNGQYLGMFQLGSWERSKYATDGYTTPLQQTRAAWRYFVASGKDWSPWECKP
jgi:hypothetical protein